MIDTLKIIAFVAGKLVKDGYYSTKEIQHKGTVDLVTEYDLKCEEYITEKLAEHFPDFIVVGEESFDGMVHYKKAIYVDPIDGTTNFVHGIPHFAISIGVWQDGEAIHGVVYNPILDEMFTASVGKGAFLNDKPIRTTKQNDLQQSLLATGFPYAKANRGKEYKWVIESMKNVLPATRDLRRLGAASLDLCYVAKGVYDGFYELGLNPWDVAAGLLIVKEAGGHITNLAGETYTLDDDIIVATNGKITTPLLSLLSVFD
jgi:myo-inositol-1(or 4)-monophosphatase